jgi:hypothetical protein
MGCIKKGQNKKCLLIEVITLIGGIGGAVIIHQRYSIQK